MSVYILQAPKHYVVVRCHCDEAEAVVQALASGGFDCGKARDVVEIKQLVDINVKRGGTWGNIDGNDLRGLLSREGFDVVS